MEIADKYRDNKPAGTKVTMVLHRFLKKFPAQTHFQLRRSVSTSPIMAATSIIKGS